jgi:hypothetical protein
MSKLRDAANGMSCVACGRQDGTVVLAHYFGPRRHSYGGGMSRKGEDIVGAHLCRACHIYMDTLSKDKEKRWENSETFLHYCALTWIRLIERGVLK